MTEREEQDLLERAFERIEHMRKALMDYSYGTELSPILRVKEEAIRVRDIADKLYSSNVKDGRKHGRRKEF